MFIQRKEYAKAIAGAGSVIQDEDEELIKVWPLIKINDSNKEQERLLILTTRAYYTAKFELLSGTLSKIRCHPLSDYASVEFGTLLISQWSISGALENLMRQKAFGLRVKWKSGAKSAMDNLMQDVGKKKELYYTRVFRAGGNNDVKVRRTMLMELGWALYAASVPRTEGLPPIAPMETNFYRPSPAGIGLFVLAFNKFKMGRPADRTIVASVKAARNSQDGDRPAGKGATASTSSPAPAASAPKGTGPSPSLASKDSVSSTRAVAPMSSSWRESTAWVDDDTDSEGESGDSSEGGSSPMSSLPSSPDPSASPVSINADLVVVSAPTPKSRKSKSGKGRGKSPHHSRKSPRKARSTEKKRRSRSRQRSNKRSAGRGGDVSTIQMPGLSNPADESLITVYKKYRAAIDGQDFAALKSVKAKAAHEKLNEIQSTGNTKVMFEFLSDPPTDMLVYNNEAKFGNKGSLEVRTKEGYWSPELATVDFVFEDKAWKVREEHWGDMPLGESGVKEWYFDPENTLGIVGPMTAEEMRHWYANEDGTMDHRFATMKIRRGSSGPFVRLGDALDAEGRVPFRR